MAGMIRRILPALFAAWAVLILAGCSDIPFLATLQKIVGGEKWVEATGAASWAPRRQFTVLDFAGKMWVLGGTNSATGEGTFSDVWSSTNGATWTRVTNTAPWGPRTAHSSAVFGGKMWVIGGFDDTPTAKNDVWYSTDGVSWTDAGAVSTWAARQNHVTVVFNGKLWVIGGSTGTAQKDVHYSSDGTMWIDAMVSLPVSGGSSMAGVVFGNRIWLMGGQDILGTRYNEVVSSGINDGTAWTAAPNAPWSARNTRAVEYNNTIWIAAGGTPSEVFNDAWYTADGSSWTQSDAPSAWNKRRGGGLVVFDNRLWVMGGWNGTTSYNDVWSFGN